MWERFTALFITVLDKKGGSPTPVRELPVLNASARCCNHIVCFVLYQTSMSFFVVGMPLPVGIIILALLLAKFLF
jgi:hypothetical protein